MRYMRGLNEWLERDVYDRQSELRGVVARVEQLSHDIRGIRAQGKDFSISIIFDETHLYLRRYIFFWIRRILNDLSSWT